MNNRRIVSFLTASLLVVLSCSSTRSKEEDIAPVARFIVGVSMVGNLPATRYTQGCPDLYRQLPRATGVTASGAVAFLALLREDITRARALYDTMYALTTKIPDTTGSVP